MEDVVAALLQSKVPVAVVLNTEFPQLLATVTDEVAGIANGGAAVPEPAALVQPLTVVVTV